MLYANVILPKPLEGTFTYSVPAEMEPMVKPGHRVLVEFGGKRLYTGLVESVTNRQPDGVAVKPIAVALDTRPIIRHPQLKFMYWLAQYYLCAIGEVFHAALPAGLNIESETIVEASCDEVDNEQLAMLDETDIELIELIKGQDKVPVKDLSKYTDIPHPEERVNRLIEKMLLKVSERSVERFVRRKATYVSLNFDRTDKAATDAAFSTTKRSANQQHMLLTLISMLISEKTDEVALTELLDKSALNRQTLKGLVDKQLVKLESRFLSKFDFEFEPDHQLPTLSEAQQKAYKQIGDSFHDKNITLLHGVTSSGKTEIYIHLIDQVLRDGNQVLMLVPEIALTTQLTRRLQRVFGNRVIIYHSKFSDAERCEIWMSLLTSNEPCLVIGARSAIFLPYARLGLVIVDEEHESSYKQTDPAPRYNGRDAAIVLASMHGAKTLLGSATPSIETYYKALEGKFGLVQLTERFGGVTLPRIEVVDLNRERERGAVTGTFSDHTVAEVRRELNAGNQIIIFHNRRGFSPIARCRLCAFIPKCDHCDVSLTYHRNPEGLVCHYCGTVYPMPKVCPSCHEPALAIVGYGTERLEDSLKSMLSDASVLRMDLDTTRNKNGHEKIIDEFSARKAQVLVGTQMVTKGLDFGGVSMVVIVNADALIHYPDFRATERAFNMLEQVAGRAGRRTDAPAGKVLIQTREPDNPVIQFVSHHDYSGFYNYEIAERRAFLYPPFVRVINIYIKHRDPIEVERMARMYTDHLKTLLGNRVSGPIEPGVARIKSLYIRKIMLKIEPEASITKVKEVLRNAYIQLRTNDLFKSLQLYYDVDPV